MVVQAVCLTANVCLSDLMSARFPAVSVDVRLVLNGQTDKVVQGRARPNENARRHKPSGRIPGAKLAGPSVAHTAQPTASDPRAWRGHGILPGERLQLLDISMTVGGMGCLQPLPVPPRSFGVPHGDGLALVPDVPG